MRGEFNFHKKIFFIFLGVTAFFFFCFSFCFAISAQLYGEVTSDGGDPNLLVWFEWGKSPSLGNQTPKMTKHGVGEFTYQLSHLDSCTTYYYRAAVSHQNFDDTHYGEIKSFTTPCPTAATVSSFQPQVLAAKAPRVEKKVKNLSDGERVFSEHCFADPSETLQFYILVDAGSGAKNVKIKDPLPAQIAFKKNTLRIDGVLTSGDITQGVELGDLPENTKKEITFEAQVLGPENFNFGQTNLTNTATLYFDGDQYSDSATVSVVKKQVAAAATAAPTGLSSNFTFFVLSVVIGILIFARKLLFCQLQFFLLKLRTLSAKTQLKLKTFFIS